MGYQQGAPTASFGYSQDMRMYMSYDFRCLKPKPKLKMDKWPHYEMHAFRKAKTEKDLAEVEEIPFDKYFMNWEDPNVLKAMTDGSEKGLELWKKTYGFDWAYWLDGNNGELKHDDFLRITTHCKLAEQFSSSFAQNCKKSGGFFKCCGKL